MCVHYICCIKCVCMCIFHLDSNCICLHGQVLFNLNINLTKAFYTFVVYMLCSSISDTDTCDIVRASWSLEADW